MSAAIARLRWGLWWAQQCRSRPDFARPDPGTQVLVASVVGRPVAGPDVAVEIGLSPTPGPLRSPVVPVVVTLDSLPFSGACPGTAGADAVALARAWEYLP